MPYSLVHAGSTLYRMAPDGTCTPIALPSGITFSSSRAMRTAILNRRVFICRAPSVNLQFNPESIGVYPITLAAPTVALTSAAGATGLPRGRYRYRYTFARKTAGGAIMAESAMSPASTPLDVVDLQVALSVIAVSSEATVNCRRLYRTTDDGDDYYNIADLSDNVTTTYTDTFGDYDLGLLAAVQILSTPPGSNASDYFRICTAWRGRIWACPHRNPDRVYFSGIDAMHQWSNSDFYAIKPEGMDQFGVIAFFTRRDELGLGKRRSVWKIIGDTKATFQPVQIIDGVGVCSVGSVVTIRDKTYFLYDDGVYEWGPEGLVSLTNAKVHPWFNTDDYFNRALFANAFGFWNPIDDTYTLHLASAGNTKLDRWISFDLEKREWLGPHRTVAFQPTCGGLLEDEDGILWPVVGGTNGYLYQENAPARNDDGSAIDMDVLVAAHHAGDPDVEHYWGELTALTKREPAGTLTITPQVGATDAPPQPPIQHDLTIERERLRRLGVGRLLQLRFQNAELNQKVELWGYEIPTHVVGRR